MAKPTKSETEKRKHIYVETPRILFDPARRPVEPVYGLPIGTATRKTVVVAIDCTMSNANGRIPNGEPNVNLDGKGFISAQSFRRILRDHAKRQGMQLYIERGAELGAVQNSFETAEAMLDQLWDLRVLGGTLTTKGRMLKGPVTVDPPTTVCPVDVVEVGLTRVSSHLGQDKEDDGRNHGNMGSYFVVKHGLYVATLHFDPYAAAALGTTEEDLAVLWQALIEGWQYNRSAHRTAVDIVAIDVFDSPCVSGSEPQVRTKSRVRWVPTCEDPQSLADYERVVDLEGMPSSMLHFAWSAFGSAVAEAAK